MKKVPHLLLVIMFILINSALAESVTSVHSELISLFKDISSNVVVSGKSGSVESNAEISIFEDPGAIIFVAKGKAASDGSFSINTSASELYDLYIFAKANYKVTSNFVQKFNKNYEQN